MKIASLNTGHADWGYDLTTWAIRAPELAQLIQTMDLDVIFLQEIFLIKYSEADKQLKNYLSTLNLPEQNFDKLALLRKALPSEYFSESALIPSSDRGKIQPGLYWGLSVISRSRIEKNRKVELTCTKFDRWPRLLQISSVTQEGHEVTLFNVHLPVESIQSRQRCALEVCQEIRASSDVSISICAGDFNDIPTVAPAMQLRTLLIESFDAAKTKDVIVDKALLSPHSNLYRACVDSRIDYIFAGSGLSFESVSYSYGTREPYLSDHPLVAAELIIR